MGQFEVCMQGRIWMAVGLLACCSGMGMAQMPMGNAQAAAVGTPMSPAGAEDALLSLLDGEMTGVVKAMPGDKFSFAPSGSTFRSSEAKFTGVRTFAQEVTHVIGANYYFYSAISGTKPDVDMKKLSAMTNKDEIVSALAASFAFAHQAIATITPENAFVTIKGANGINTRATLASFGVAHGYDHYGQMVEYLRMNGVLPPGSK